MKKCSYAMLLFGLMITIISCKELDKTKQANEVTLAENVYFSEEIGWTIEIPEKWSIISRKQNETYQEKGLEAIEDAVAAEIDASSLKYLIGFQKNRLNLFQSTSEPYKASYDGEWEESNTATKQVIYATYVDQGIKADSTETKITQIDGLDFKYYEFTIYGPEGKEILRQLMYARLINGNDFSVNINYNNETDKKVMLKAWLNSKFTK